MSLVAVRSWAAEILAGHGLRLAGELEVVKERPWSLVAKIPTADGAWWFKENRGATGRCPGTAR